MNRRTFFRNSMILGVSLAVQSLFFRKYSFAKSVKTAPAEFPILKMSDPSAVKNGYNYDATLVDTTKWKKKAAKDGDDQKCVTCSRYTVIDGNHGTCDVFPKNTVNWNAWCDSWEKKA